MPEHPLLVDFVNSHADDLDTSLADAFEEKMDSSDDEVADHLRDRLELIFESRRQQSEDKS